MTDVIREWFRDTTDVREGEGPAVALMFAYGFLAMASYYLVKPARNSIFVDRVGSEGLSYAYILTAAFVALVMVGYSRYVDRVGRRTLLLSTFAFLVTSLVAFWWLLLWDTSFWSSGAFYIYTKLYSLLLVSQFWLVANLLFTTRQAKRLFGLTGLGLILGAAAGSAVAGTATSAIGTERLLLAAAGVVAICALIVVGLGAHMKEGGEASGRVLEELSGDAVRLLLRSRHLRTIAGILALTVLAHTLMDWQLNRAVEITIPGEDAKTAFWGRFFFLLNIASVVIQLFFTSFVLRKFGVGIAVFALPVGLLVANIGIVLLPVLLVVALAEGAENAIRYSLDQSTREVLFLPISTEAKYKVKPLIDLAVYRGGTGLAGVVLLVAVNWLGGDIRTVAGIAVLLIVAWVALAARMRVEYMSTLARSIDRRFASAEGAFDSIAPADVLPVVQEALSGDDLLRIAFVLDLVEKSGESDIELVSDELHRLLLHDEPHVRARALEVLAHAPEALDVARVRERLDDPVAEVRERAVRALVAASPDRRVETVEDLLGAGEREVRLATLRCLARDELSLNGGGDVGRPYLEERRRAAAAGDADARVEVALSAGTILLEAEARDLLESLLDDDDPRVASAAIRSAGRLEDRRFLPRLVSALGSGSTRAVARAALVAQGPRAVDVLAEHLLDDREDPAVRRSIPSVLSRIPTQETVDALLELHLAPETEQLLDYRTLRALSRLRAGHGELAFDAHAVEEILKRDVAAARRYREARAILEGEELAGRGGRMLDRALEEGRRERRECVFRSLGLLHDPDEIHRCYKAVVGDRERSRDNALEWLEGTVGPVRWRQLAPVLSDGDRAAVGRRPLPEMLRHLWDDSDTFIARCALWTAVEEFPERARPEFSRYEPYSHELAELARRLKKRRVEGVGVGAPPDGEMELVDKVAFLQEVDLLRRAPCSLLAVLASIASEVDVSPGETLVRRGEPNDSLHLVVRGEVELRGMGGETVVASENTPFGTWSLFDSGPSEVDARARRTSRLLRITRSGFQDLLTDHPELATGMLQGLASRLRSLLS